MRIREYRGPLGILAAGALGITLLCSVSAMAMSDLNNYIPATLVPLNIVDLAVANLNTAVGLTEQAVTQFVPTETATLVPTSTATSSFTPLPSDTPRRFFTVTPRRTRPPREATLAPSNPIRTNPPPPAPTRTPVPPTATDVPPTPVPPTPVPPTPIPPTPVPPTPVPPTNIPTDPPTQPPTEPPPPTLQPGELSITEGATSP